MDSMDAAKLVTYRSLVGTVTATATIAFSLYWWLKAKPLHNFPHNPITSFLGDVPEIAQFLKSGKTIVDYYALLIERHGPVVQMCIGNQIYLIIGDQAEAERLFTGKNVDLNPHVNEMFIPLIPTGQISLPTNEMWKHHRRVVGPSMHRRYLARMADHVSSVANSLVKLWDAKVDRAQHKSFGVDIDIKQATMDSIATIATGSSLSCIESAIRSVSMGPASTHNVADLITGDPMPIYHAIRTVMIYATNAASLPFPSITIPIYMRLSPTWRRDSKLLRAFISEKVTEARQREDSITKSGGLVTDADCVLDMLIQQEVREGSGALSMNELVDELIVMFLAGQETTAAVLTWFVKFMAKDPGIQRRLHDEVCSVFGQDGEDSSPMTLSALSDVEKMPVLEAVTTETLRCAHVAGAGTRRLLSDDTVMGRHVPKHVHILLPLAYSGTRESDWGADAKEWRPSRWLRPDGTFNRNAGPDGSPFGLGHRSCFGQKLAIMQLKIFIATISRVFFFQPVAPEVDSLDAVAVLTFQPKECYVKLRRWDAEA